jgi:Tol biopolymer transport system component
LARLSRRQKLGLGGGAVVLACLALVAVLAGGGDDGTQRAQNQKRSSRGARGPGPVAGKNRGGGPRSAGSTKPSPGGGGAEGVPEWSVWVVTIAGGRPRVAAPTPSEVPVTPAWSELKGRIAFVRPTCEDCDAAVWTSRPDGSSARKLRTRLGDQTDPAWSPSGRSLAVVRVGRGLYTVSTRDGAARPLLAHSVVEDPVWSPGGGAIVFARRQGVAGWDLYSIRPNGSGLRRLTRSRAQELAPDWSPDGKRIAFQRQEKGGAWSVYVMRADGSNVRRLIAGTSAHSIEQPAWSPGGGTIAFVGVTLAGSRIEVVRLGSGRPPRSITGPSLQAADPDWSPDGRRLVFSAKRAGG